MRRIFAAGLLLGASSYGAPPAASAITANDVFLYLTRVITWHQHVMAIDRDAALSENLLQRNNLRDFGKRTMQASFAFARAEAAILGSAGAAGGATEDASQGLQQSLSKAAARVNRLEERLQGLEARLQHASDKQRGALLDEKTAIAADLALAKQVETAVKNMTAFGAPKTGARSGLLEQISALEALNPVNEPAEKEKPASQREQTSAPVFHAENAGIVTLASKALDVSNARKQIDAVRKETSELLDGVNRLREPMRTAVRAIVAESDRISNSEDNSIQASEWLETGKQIAQLSTRFKQLSSVIVPLSEAAMSVQSAHGALNEWRKDLLGEYETTLRYLAIRLGVLLGGVLLVLLGSAIWQRAILRYVVEPRRRRQLLLVKRVVVGAALALLLTLGFFSGLGSMATLLGFITAGLALALQNVILSAVAYFFLIGKYGLRVGDRITVQGVTGQVIEVGLIRLFLMELAGSGTDMHPTGRLAVFANSVIFQPLALMKQAPGMDYAWHAVTATVEGVADYQQTRERFSKAVTAVYEDYRHAIEQQHKEFEASTDFETRAPELVSRAQFSDKGLEIAIRYPVSLNEKPGHIDERIVDCLVAEAEKEPRLKLAAGSPKVEQVI